MQMRTLFADGQQRSATDSTGSAAELYTCTDYYNISIYIYLGMLASDWQSVWGGRGRRIDDMFICI